MGPGAKAVRAQQLVQLSRAAVLGLVARRDDDLRALTLVERSAAAEVRAATVKVVAAQGVRRVATVLSVPPAIVRALCSEEQSTAVLDALAPRLLPAPGSQTCRQWLNTAASPARPRQVVGQESRGPGMMEVVPLEQRPY